MTPKEKAKELVYKMLYCYQGHIDEYTAKQCAIIAVDEILNGSRLFYIEDYDYWREVHQEIQKL